MIPSPIYHLWKTPLVICITSARGAFLMPIYRKPYKKPYIKKEENPEKVYLQGVQMAETVGFEPTP